MCEYNQQILDKTEHMVHEFLEYITAHTHVSEWTCKDVCAIKDALKSIYYKESIDAHKASNK